MLAVAPLKKSDLTKFSPMVILFHFIPELTSSSRFQLVGNHRFEHNTDKKATDEIPVRPEMTIQ
jgi:hypothetical protein